MCTCIHISYMHMYVTACFIYTCMCTHTYMYIYICIHIYIHIYIYVTHNHTGNPFRRTLSESHKASKRKTYHADEPPDPLSWNNALSRNAFRVPCTFGLPCFGTPKSLSNSHASVYKTHGATKSRQLHQTLLFHCGVPNCWLAHVFYTPEIFDQVCDTIGILGMHGTMILVIIEPLLYSTCGSFPEQAAQILALMQYIYIIHIYLFFFWGGWGCDITPSRTT